MVETNFAINVGRKMLVGSGTPMLALSAMMLRGITVRPDAFNTRKVICASDAVSFCGLSSWSSCIAFSTRGVAALSSPKIFALKFMMIEPLAGWSLGTPGNNLAKNGPTTFDNIRTIPPCSPIFINPSQRDITPVK